MTSDLAGALKTKGKTDAQEGLSEEVVSELRSEGQEGASHGRSWEDIPGRRNCSGRCPKMRVNGCVWASVAGVMRAPRRVERWAGIVQHL